MRRRTVGARRKSVALVAASIAALVLPMTACSSAPNTVSSHAGVPTSNTRTEPPNEASRTATRALAPQYPFVSGKVEIYVRVPATRVASDERDFIASVVLVNGLGHSFPVPGKCNGWLAAGLASATIPFERANSAVACANGTIHEGITRLARTVDTTYESCSQDPHAAVTAGFPVCTGIKHNQMPRLPLGRYRLQLDTSNIPNAVISAPITITLTKP